MVTTYRLKDIHASYLRRGGTKDLKEFKSIIQTFLKNLFAKLLEGEKFNMGYRLGALQICRMERNFKKPIPDWGESNKIKAKLISEGKPLYNKETGEGHMWVVYHTDPYFYGLTWRKEYVAALGKKLLKNVWFYQLHVFARTRRAIAANIAEESVLVYEFLPSKRKKVA